MEMLSQASILQIEHPWLFPFAKEVSAGKPIIFVAHNVESTLWESSDIRIFPKRWKLKPRELDEYAAQNATAIVTMSETDAQILINDFGASESVISIIPNGVDLSTRVPATVEEKLAAKKRIGLTDKPIVLFVGSEHYPNREALDIIQSWPSKTGDKVHFVIVGSVGAGRPSTPMMTITGFVKDIKDYLDAADIAINPLISGSGTSLKIVEYLACGIPTVTTPLGMRGLCFIPGRDLLICAVEEFPERIVSLSTDENLKKMLCQSGRRSVEAQYGWQSLSNKMIDVYHKVGL
jgi:glycosyltransferase involved in cell wall biosynthesis